MAKIRRSRTFVVVIRRAPHVSAVSLNFLVMMSRGEKFVTSEILYERAAINMTQGDFKTVLALLRFSHPMLTIRSFDFEEKRWMDESREFGVVAAPGNRDGSWGVPSLEEFERDYLAVV